MHMVESGFSITIRVEDPIVHGPIMTAVWVDIQAVDQCDALDQTMNVSTVLLFDQLNIMRVVFIKNGIIIGLTQTRARNVRSYRATALA